MRRNKLLLTVIMLVIALVPTYLIIYQSIVATGLPDFDKQTSVEVIYLGTTKKEDTYLHGSDGYLALTTVLEHISYVSSLPENVEINARHEIVFTARDGGKSRYFLYASKTELAFYLETPQGKHFRLDFPAATYKGNELSPISVGYYVLQNNVGSPESSVNHPKPVANTISSLSDLSSIRFSQSTQRVDVAVYGANDTFLERYDTLTHIGTHENAKYVNLTVDFKLTETVICRATYRLTLP